MRADQFKPFQKSVVVIAGSGRGPSKWKKGPSVPKDNAADPIVVSPSSPTNFSELVMDIEPPVEHVVAIPTSSNAHREPFLRHEKERVIEGLFEGVAKLGCEVQKAAYVSNVQVNPKQGIGISERTQREGGAQSDRTPLQDLSNFQNNTPESATLRTWKKLAREVNSQQENVDRATSLDRRHLMELDEPQPVKRRCMQNREVFMKENYTADAGCQHPQGQ